MPGLLISDFDLLHGPDAINFSDHFGVYGLKVVTRHIPILGLTRHPHLWINMENYPAVAQNAGYVRGYRRGLHHPGSVAIHRFFSNSLKPVVFSGYLAFFLDF